jgi:uncharacterized protein (TIGR00730 family)
MKKTKEVGSEIFESFKQENKKAGIRVFVAGGSRSGRDTQYIEEAYDLGRKIVEMDFKLDFGLSNRGIMGAVARGVLDGWNTRQGKIDDAPIQGITTEKYFELYPSDDDLIKKMDIVVAHTLEERKQKLLNADFVVFAPGGVGTLDELAYDCVAMQDGMLSVKPFIIYNINGFFHHLLEFLKSIANEGFADPVPFIVVNNAEELEIAFRWLKMKKIDYSNSKEVFVMSRRLVYELPYYSKQKEYYNMDVVTCSERMEFIKEHGTDFDQKVLQNEIHTAYLEKEIEKMYDRLAQTGRDTGVVSEKLAELKKRKKEMLK